MDGNPDMGRKVFQPEIKVLADELSRRVVDVFKRYLKLMREDTGAPSPTASNDLWQWKLEQIGHRDSHTFELNVAGKRIGLLSEPQSEQDVISLFHELIGAEVLAGYGIFATSESDRYDCLFATIHHGNSLVYSKAVPLGVAQRAIYQGESQPFVLEYKYGLDALIADFEKEKKFEPDIDLVVCWDMGQEYKERYVLRSYLVGDEGSTRTFFGATHAAFRDGQRSFEIIWLSDLLAFLKDPETVRAKHKTTFR